MPFGSFLGDRVTLPRNHLFSKFLRARLVCPKQFRLSPIFPPIEMEFNQFIFQSVDLLDPAVLSHVKSLISQGWVLGIHFGTPCSSFSIARKNDGGPPPLRSKAALWGLQHLAGKDLEKVQLGNTFLDITVQLAMLCHDHGIPWSIENPAGSFLWSMPTIIKLVRRCRASIGLRWTCVVSARST